MLGEDHSSAEYNTGVYKYFQDRNGCRRTETNPVCKDVHIFNGYLLQVQGMESTGQNEDDIFCIAVVLNLRNFVPGQGDSSLSTKYNFKLFDVRDYVFVKECTVRKMYPKFNPGTRICLEAPESPEYKKNGGSRSGFGGAPSGLKTFRSIGDRDRDGVDGEDR